MLVNMKVKKITDAYGGALTPELALGYRAVLSSQIEFETLEDVSALIYNSTAAQIAIQTLLRPDSVTIQDYGKHIFMFCHVVSGSVIRLEMIARLFDMPICCISIEDNIRRGLQVKNTELEYYQKKINSLVNMVMTSPAVQLFSIQRRRCRPVGSYSDALCRFARCERCKKQIRMNRLYDVEGFCLCAQCAEVDPLWFKYY